MAHNELYPPAIVDCQADNIALQSESRAADLHRVCSADEQTQN